MKSNDTSKLLRSATGQSIEEGGWNDDGLGNLEELRANRAAIRKIALESGDEISMEWAATREGWLEETADLMDEFVEFAKTFEKTSAVGPGPFTCCMVFDRQGTVIFPAGWEPVAALFDKQGTYKACRRGPGAGKREISLPDATDPGRDDWERQAAENIGESNNAKIRPILAIRVVTGKVVKTDAVDDLQFQLKLLRLAYSTPKFSMCRACGLPIRYCSPAGKCVNKFRLGAGLWPVLIMQDADMKEGSEILLCAGRGTDRDGICGFYYGSRIATKAKAVKWAEAVYGDASVKRLI